MEARQYYKGIMIRSLNGTARVIKAAFLNKVASKARKLYVDLVQPFMFYLLSYKMASWIPGKHCAGRLARILSSNGCAGFITYWSIGVSRWQEMKNENGWIDRYGASENRNMSSIYTTNALFWKGSLVNEVLPKGNVQMLDCPKVLHRALY